MAVINVQRAGTVFHGTRQSSAQVIDGSLRFVTGSNPHLKRTPTTAGNRRVWTWSGWCGDKIWKFQASITGPIQVIYYHYMAGDNDSIERASRTSDPQIS